MRMTEGVEWAAHICILLHWVRQDSGHPVPAARLAQAYALPTAYLTKQLQALARAGITESTAGRTGGIRLMRPATEVTLMDVVAAIEGPEDAFRCTEIRQRGMNAGQPATEFTEPCGIAHAMRRAELAWRRELAATTIADLAGTAPAGRAADARRYLLGTSPTLRKDQS
ncbi:RrF2 family transcriptional regulator [Ruania halotolerans]|uniref:RrF2 family transcriptional regulator n=1 Tax=Ruania halotolerans TaxID=2897773 RepID=UPI001E60FA23|nr:Rrf2 family transcriptional regulator [Ruania halotolerans]UFU07763.1 Rrf2 family transcriptional regulator [Ruania halotolerans]